MLSGLIRRSSAFALRWTTSKENKTTTLASASYRLRQFASSSDEETDISKYLSEQAGIDEKLHRGILRALQSVYGNSIRLQDVKGFGTTGLLALAESVQQQMPKVSSDNKERPSVMIHFKIPHHRTEFDLEWHFGESVLDVSHSAEGEVLLREYIEATCGGTMSCCTCHIYLEKDLFKKLPKPEKAELDMLDLAFEPRKSQSRLACQVKLDDEFLKHVEGDKPITITIPADANNVWS